MSTKTPDHDKAVEALINLRDALRRLRRIEQSTYRRQGQVEIGDFTYGTPIVRSWGEKDAKLIIGKFCSIGANVQIFLGGNHHNEWCTTYPFNALPQLRGLWDDIDCGVAATKGDVIIGNDVWIANDVTIMSGVKIGDGATIANGAVVVKNVKPYSIVGGVPAKHIKWRAAAQNIKGLRWWDWTIDEIADAVPILLSSAEKNGIPGHKLFDLI